MKRRLEIEALEDRHLATAGLNSLQSLPHPMPQVNPAPVVHVQIEAILCGGITDDISGGLISPAGLRRGGARDNHNETLVRDTSKKARKPSNRRRRR